MVTSENSPTLSDMEDLQHLNDFGILCFFARSTFPTRTDHQDLAVHGWVVLFGRPLRAGRLLALEQLHIYR